MNTQPYYITQTQYQTLQAYINNGDRTGFYIALHDMTGSQSALDMAEISSSSDLAGGAAWAINTSYEGSVPGYPSDVESFSVRVAQGDFDLIHPTTDGLYKVPSDLQMYEGARATWNRVGGENGNPLLGNEYFPGNWLIAEHYILAGDLASARQYVSPDTLKTFLFGLGAGLWEGFTEIVADPFNYTRSLNDYLDAHPNASFNTYTSPSGAELTVVKDEAGKTIGVVRGDGALGFGGKFLDGVHHVLEPFVDMLNDLGIWITAAQRELAIQQLQVRRIDAELQGRTLTREPADDALLFVQAQAQARAHHQEYLDSVAQENAARERARKELAAGVEVMRKLEKTLPSYRRTAESYEKLSAQHLVGAIEAEERRRDALEKEQDLETQRATAASLEAAVSQSDRRLVQLKSSYESDLRTARLEAVGRATQLEQDGVKLKFRQGHLELRAPQAGTVKELATTTIGAVVQPGTVLLSLVPMHEPLLAEVAVENQDIGFVRTGQRVRLKVATFPFQKYGMVEGIVKTVIADTNSQATSSSREPLSERSTGVAQPPTSSFKAMVELNGQSIYLNQASFPLAAGMQLTAEIVEGKRTVLQYLLSPVQQVTSEAGTER